MPNNDAAVDENNTLMPDQVWVSGRIGKRVRALMLSVNEDQLNDDDVLYTRVRPIPAGDVAVEAAIRERQVVRRKWSPNVKEQEIIDIDHLLNTCDSLRAERNMLGDAIAKAALKAGIYNGEVSLTGPQLILLCDDLARRSLNDK